MNENSFLPPPVRLSQAIENGDYGGGGVTRRTFVKRTGGATVAAMVAWNLASQQTRAQEADILSVASFSYRMKLDEITPESGEDWHTQDGGAAIDGTQENIRIAIEILSGPPLGGFPDSAIRIDFGYTVIATVAIERNGVFQQVASHAMSFDAQCGLRTTTGPTLQSAVSESNDEEDPQVLPQVTGISFQFNNGGSTYTLSIDSLDYTGMFNGIGNPEDPGDQTFVSAAAKLSGNGLNMTTNVKDVTHTFVSFLPNPP